MEKAFWVGGPVPPAHLDALALPRPAAMEQVQAALASPGVAWIGGAPGDGQTTLLHQTARTSGQPVVVLDLRGLLRAGAGDALAHLTRDRRRGPGPQVATWDEALRAWHPAAMLAFDGFDPRRHGWVQAVATELGRPVLAAGPGGPIQPDPIAAPAAQGFLERRSRRVRVAWTGAALREAVAMAAGKPAALQAIGAAAMHSCLERADRRVLLEDVLDAAVAAARLDPAGEPSWRRLAGPRRALLLAMAQEPEAMSSTWARRCGLDPKAAVVHLARLVQGGFIERQGRGRYGMAPLLRLALRPSGGAMVRLVGPSGPPAAHARR